MDKKLEILVVQPYFREAGKKIGEKHKDVKKSPLLPLSITYLAALIPQEHNITVIDEKMECLPNGFYDLVAISSTTVNVIRGFEIASQYRKMGCMVIIGGIHASLNPHEALRYCDSVCIGEAENVINDIINDCKKGRLKKIYQGTQSDLLDIPFPKHSYLRLKKYWKLFPFFKYPTLPIFFSRGCPHDCLFCTVPEIYGRKVRYRPIEQVIKEIEYAGAESFWFIDDNILINSEKAKKLFLELIPLKKKLIMHFDASSYKKPKLVEMAGKAGCVLANVGIESFDQEKLESYKKYHNDVRKYKDLVKICANAGISISASVIVGHQNDTPDSIMRVVDCLMDCGFKDAQITTLTAYPGTRFFSIMEIKGYIKSRDWSKYNDTTPTLIPDNMSEKEYAYYYSKVWKKYFSTSNIVRRTLFKPWNTSVPYLLWALDAKVKLKKGYTSPQTD